jgi:hypothetical protein
LIDLPGRNVLLINKQNPIRARAATEIRYFSDRLLAADRPLSPLRCDSRAASGSTMPMKLWQRLSLNDLWSTFVVKRPAEIGGAVLGRGYEEA